MSFLIDPVSWVFTIFISRCPFGEAVYIVRIDSKREKSELLFPEELNHGAPANSPSSFQQNFTCFYTLN